MPSKPPRHPPVWPRDHSDGRIARDGGRRSRRPRVDAQRLHRRGRLERAATELGLTVYATDAAVSVRKLHEVAVQQEVQVVAARTAERLARLRYDGGVSNYLEVLDAQRSLFAAQQALVLFRLEQATSQVQLYAALGGGWESASPPGRLASVQPSLPSQ